MARVILQSLFEESLIRKSGEEELLVLLTTCIDHPQTPNPCRQSADKHMETDLQVKFIKKRRKKNPNHSLKKKKKCSTYEFGGLSDREHLPRFLKAKLRLAEMPQQACFTCKTSQNVSTINATRLEYRHVQQKQLHSQVGARSAFWKRHTRSPCLDNNLQICCLTECAHSLT